MLVQGSHIRAEPDFFGTTIMLAHHGVGSSTRDMTPGDSILASSCILNFLAQGNGDIARGEQHIGLGIWLQLDLKAILDSAKASE